MLLLAMLSQRGVPLGHAISTRRALGHVVPRRCALGHGQSTDSSHLFEVPDFPFLPSSILSGGQSLVQSLSME